MSLEKFKIVLPKDGHNQKDRIEDILINTLHIVSIKPTMIAVDEKEVRAFRVRTNNGKRYYAVEIPSIVLDKLGPN